MSSYLVIGSRDPFEHAAVPGWLRLVSELAQGGSEVTLFLVENGVLAARRSRFSPTLGELRRHGVTVLADAFSLRERGIGADRLAQGVAEAPIDAVIDHMERGARAVWH